MGVILQTLIPFLFLGVMGTSMYVVSHALSEHQIQSREGTPTYRRALYAILALALGFALLRYGANEAMEFGSESPFSGWTGIGSCAVQPAQARAERTGTGCGGCSLFR